MFTLVSELYSPNLHVHSGAPAQSNRQLHSPLGQSNVHVVSDLISLVLVVVVVVDATVVVVTG